MYNQIQRVHFVNFISGERKQIKYAWYTEIYNHSVMSVWRLFLEVPTGVRHKAWWQMYLSLNNPN